jgi:hypothetical protein
MNTLMNFLYKNWQNKIFYIFLAIIILMLLKFGVKMLYFKMGDTNFFTEIFRDLLLSYFLFYLTLVYIKIKELKKEINDKLKPISSNLKNLTDNPLLMSENILLYKELENKKNDLEIKNNSLDNEIIKLEKTFLWITAITAFVTFLSILFK